MGTKLLEVIQIKHEIKDRLLFKIDQLQIYGSDRIGLVGSNGSGKTTLLNILSGQLEPDEGTVIHHAKTELLPQLKRTDDAKSGGEVTQAYINDAISKAPALLLADEPTTNLDTEHIEWVEKILSGWKGAFVVVSHDRAFLDALCTSIWEISDGKVNVYKGNYSDFEQQKELELGRQQQAYEQYTAKKRQLEEALKLKEKKAAKATKAPKKVSRSEARILGAKPYFAKKQKKLQQTAKALETRMEKLDKVEKVKEAPPLKMNLPNETSVTDRVIIRVQEVAGKVGGRLLWEKASFHVRGGDKLAIIGPNGSGKTTFIKKILAREEGIVVSPSVKVGYFSQNLTILDPNRSILDNVKATSKQDETLIRTVLARLHFFRDDVYKQVNVLSGGERVKVALAKVFLSDMNTLILDEPTNYLDIAATSALESLLKEYAGTVLFVSHDRRFIEHVATSILSIRDNQMTWFEGTYKEFKQYVHGQDHKNPIRGKGIKGSVSSDVGHMERQLNEKLKEEQRLVLETKITEVLSRLSIEPSEENEQEFQMLLIEKKKLDAAD